MSQHVATDPDHKYSTNSDAKAKVVKDYDETPLMESQKYVGPDEKNPSKKNSTVKSFKDEPQKFTEVADAER
jgi:hypothetical protein